MSAAEPGFWKRAAKRADAFGQRVGRKTHHTIISLILIFWVIASVVAVALVIWIALSDIDPKSQMAQTVFSSSELAIFGNTFWLGVIILLESLLAVLSLVAVFNWFRGNEALGLNVSSFWGSLL